MKKGGFWVNGEGVSFFESFRVRIFYFGELRLVWIRRAGFLSMN